jgi:hypothetical protein
MLLEMRTYTIHPANVAPFLALVERDGMPLQLRFLGQCLGYYTTDVGTLNQMIQIWAYENAVDRENRRAKMATDPAWLHYVERALPLIHRQENILLKPTSFSPASHFSQSHSHDRSL